MTTIEITLEMQEFLLGEHVRANKINPNHQEINSYFKQKQLSTHVTAHSS